MTKVEQIDLINLLAKTNDMDYNLLKTAEECNELAEVVLKKVLKRGGFKEPDLNSIVEEIGDVMIRCSILTQALNAVDLVDKRVNYKLEKYKKYIEDSKYNSKI